MAEPFEHELLTVNGHDGVHVRVEAPEGLGEGMVAARATFELGEVNSDFLAEEEAEDLACAVFDLVLPRLIERGADVLQLLASTEFVVGEPGAAVKGVGADAVGGLDDRLGHGATAHLFGLAGDGVHGTGGDFAVDPLGELDLPDDVGRGLDVATVFHEKVHGDDEVGGEVSQWRVDRPAAKARADHGALHQRGENLVQGHHPDDGGRAHVFEDHAHAADEGRGVELLARASQVELLREPGGLSGALAGQIAGALDEEVAVFGANHPVRVDDL